MSLPPDEHQHLLKMVDAAQRAAGVLAARHRDDAEGVAALMGTFPDDAALAGGSLLVADLALGLLREESGRTMDECVQHLALRLERFAAAAGAER
ncbi:MAG: hypothetical protein M3R63_15055 [Actinomycetota bacterium]|nr:hypothetical protein [Actinomycetota bacterium]